MPLMAEGEFALMEQHLVAAISAGASTGFAPGGDCETYALLVDGAAVERDEPAIRKYIAQAEESAKTLDHKMNLAIADRAWGVAHALAGEYAAAGERLKRAMEVFSAYPAPWQMGRTQFELGELARLQGRLDEARMQYERALAGFEALHAEPDVQRARSALRSLEQGRAKGSAGG